MRIALIWTYGFDTTSVLPISLAILKSNLEDHDVKILDCSLKNIRHDSEQLETFITGFKPEIVGISCWTFNYREALRVLKKVKQIDNKIITIMGGCHVTLTPKDALSHDYVDFVFRGEADLEFKKFIEKKSDIKGHVTSINYVHDLNQIKRPDYNDINIKEYWSQGYEYFTKKKHNAPIFVTRGCPYSCKFCSASLLNGKAVRYMDVESAIGWVKELYSKGVRHINIIDDNFSINKEWVTRFCNQIIDLDLDLTFGTPNGLRIEHLDESIFKLLKKAGWDTVVIAPESGSKRILKLMGKSIDLTKIPLILRQIRKAKLKVIGFFIIGYPTETKEDLKQTSRLIRKSRFDFFFLHTFNPIPGTPVFNELQLSDSHMDFTDTRHIKGDINYRLFVIMEYLFWVLSNPIAFFHLFQSTGTNKIVFKLRQIF